MAEHPQEIVQSAYDAFGRRDLPALFRLLSPDVEIRQSTELPWGGEYRGHAGAREFLARLMAHLTSTVAIDRLIDSGDRISAIGWTSGRVNASGAGFRVPIVHVWKVEAGLVTRVRFLIDHPTMRAALAAGTPAAGASPGDVAGEGIRGSGPEPIKIHLFDHDEQAESFPPDHVVFRAGEPGDSMFAVLEGTVAIVIHGQTVEVVGAGGVFGEMALVEDRPRIATAVVGAAAKLVTIGRKRFRFLVQQNPYFALQLMKVMADRLRRMDEKL